MSFTFGPDVVSRFLQKHDMDLICRAHQVGTCLARLLFIAPLYGLRPTLALVRNCGSRGSSVTFFMLSGFGGHATRNADADTCSILILQVVEDGYEFFAKRHLVTLFSAPNYCGEFDNAGAMMSVDDTLLCSFQVRPFSYSLGDRKCATARLHVLGR